MATTGRSSAPSWGMMSRRCPSPSLFQHFPHNFSRPLQNTPIPQAIPPTLFPHPYNAQPKVQRNPIHRCLPRSAKPILAPSQHRRTHRLQRREARPGAQHCRSQHIRDLPRRDKLQEAISMPAQPCFYFTASLSAPLVYSTPSSCVKRSEARLRLASLVSLLDGKLGHVTLLTCMKVRSGDGMG